jgi:hypothetical protein
MRYTVPQFIDVEDKILGPITVRQFIIMLITSGLMFVQYSLLTFGAFLLMGLPTFALGGVVAFMRINGQPFHYFLLNMAQTFSKPRLRSWNKDLSDGELNALISAPPPKPPEQKVVKEALVSSKLSELSLVVNTGGVYNPDES